MGKKGSFWDNPFGGMFDFNRDGREDLGEQWIAMKIFEECTKEEQAEKEIKVSTDNITNLDDLDIDGI